MKILLRLPNWLGDCVMATYAIELIYKSYPDATFYLVGSQVSIELFKGYKNTHTIIDNSKKAKSRILYIYKLARQIPKCDIAVTFQNNFLSALLIFLNKATTRIGYKNECRSFLLNRAKVKPKNIHEVFIFSELIQDIVNVSIKPKLYIQKSNIDVNIPKGKIAGINAGAAFGSAKRWSEEYFAKVSNYLISQDYKIILFGSKDEYKIANKIEKMCNKEVMNLAGKTNIQELIFYISKLDLFITNDSGPMHIAAAFDIPTIAIFGSTNHEETSPFSKNSHIVSLKTLNMGLDCQPCKKRECPLPRGSNYHACMIDLKPDFIIEKIKSITK